VLTSLITLPFRVALRGAELGLRVSQALAERAIGLVGEVLAPTASRPTSPPARKPERESEPSREAESPASSGGDPRSAAPSPLQAVAEQEEVAASRPDFEPPPPPAEPSTPAEPSPPAAPPPPAAPRAAARAGSAHLDDEDVVVEEVAEAGAEQGAGAQIHVAEPWDGYDQLKAADVVDQLDGRDQAELAAVELYELSHRQRKTVIEAAKQQLRRAHDQP
jgi:hypothetical protein